MIVAAHQPAYLPWLGYLDKMAKADVFVVMDDLQYEAQNFQNRNRIKRNDGAAWVTVPLQHGPQTDRICDKRIENRANPREHWQRKTLRQLEIHYGGTRFFARYADELRAIYTCPWERLVDLDLCVLELARRAFDIRVPILRSSSLGLRGQKTDRILDLCRALGANCYLSGRGGSTSYLDVDLLRTNGVSVLWQEFEHPIYPQRYPSLGFVSRLAFVDLLCNCGPDSRDVLWSGGLAA
ncbi:MAG TPA: WbqC family protein [Kofleriaceae bacterium]|nr:WbqC family protein [Kofleriaceae bacterium]